MTHYSGDKLPPYYIGSTSVKKVENGYHGTPSSKKYKSVWNEERKNNPHLFKTTILNRHTTRDEAYLDEIKWQTKLNVVENDLFVNMAILHPNWSNQGRKASEEARTKMSIVQTGRTLSEETKTKISVVNTGRSRGPQTEASKEKNRQSHLGKKASAETKAKMSKSQLGRKHSEETKLKMRKPKSKRGKNADNDT
jgi:hypothetical protein